MRVRVRVRRNFNIIGAGAGAGADKYRDLRCGWKCGCGKKKIVCAVFWGKILPIVLLRL